MTGPQGQSVIDEILARLARPWWPHETERSVSLYTNQPSDEIEAALTASGWTVFYRGDLTFVRRPPPGVTLPPLVEAYVPVAADATVARPAVLTDVPPGELDDAFRELAKPWWPHERRRRVRGANSDAIADLLRQAGWIVQKWYDRDYDVIWVERPL